MHTFPLFVFLNLLIIIDDYSCERFLGLQELIQNDASRSSGVFVCE